MSEAMALLIGAVAGAVIGFAGTWLTNRASAKNVAAQLDAAHRRADAERRRERLEELYVLISHWATEFVATYISLSRVMQGQLTYDEHLAFIIEDQKDHDFARMEMIIDVYGIELHEQYGIVKTGRDRVNEIVMRHKHAYRGPDNPGEEFLKPYTAAVLQLNQACDEFRTAVAALVRA